MGPFEKTCSYSAKSPKKYEYTPAENEQIRRYALLGMPDGDIADVYGVPPDLFSHWKKKYPELKDSLASGRERAGARVANALYRRAVGYVYEEVTKKYDENGELKSTDVTKKHMAPETKAAEIYLYNRHSQLWKRMMMAEHGSQNLVEVLQMVQETIGMVDAGSGSPPDRPMIEAETVPEAVRPQEGPAEKD